MIYFLILFSHYFLQSVVNPIMTKMLTFSRCTLFFSPSCLHIWYFHACNTQIHQANLIFFFPFKSQLKCLLVLELIPESPFSTGQMSHSAGFCLFVFFFLFNFIFSVCSFLHSSYFCFVSSGKVCTPALVCFLVPLKVYFLQQVAVLLTWTRLLIGFSLEEHKYYNVFIGRNIRRSLTSDYLLNFLCRVYFIKSQNNYAALAPSIYLRKECINMITCLTW